MRSLVSYKAPGLESREEPISRLDKRQLLFIIFLPLLFLMSAILSIAAFSALGLSLSTSPVLSSIVGFVCSVMVFLIIIPLVFRLPKGKTSIRQYLDDIGVGRIRPIIRTLLIFFPCLLSILGTQILASYIYNHFILGWTPSAFSASLFNESRILTRIGWSPLFAIVSIWEEVVLRGVVLTMLNQVYSERRAIAESALAFGYVHIINLLNGPVTYDSLMFVAGQITWATIIGVLYGYMFITTRNLYANMFLHYTANAFGNCFMHLPYASIEVVVSLNILFNIGLFSTLLSLVWVLLVKRFWPLINRSNLSGRYRDN